MLYSYSDFCYQLYFPLFYLLVLCIFFIFVAESNEKKL